MASHGTFTSVVRRDGLAYITVETLEQPGKMKCANPEVLLRIEQVAWPVRPCGCRHQLHQAFGALGRKSARVVRRLDGDHRMHQASVDPGTSRCLGNVPLKATGRTYRR
jgi:hypothetical protein